MRAKNTLITFQNVSSYEDSKTKRKTARDKEWPQTNTITLLSICLQEILSVCVHKLGSSMMNEKIGTYACGWVELGTKFSLV